MTFVVVSERPIFQVDFNEMLDDSRVLLSQNDFRESYTGKDVQLTEGLPVLVIEVNDYGADKELLFGSGIAQKNSFAESMPWTKAATWICELDAEGVKAESRTFASSQQGLGVLSVSGYTELNSGSFLVGDIVKGAIKVGDVCVCVTNSGRIEISALEFPNSEQDTQTSVAIQLSNLADLNSIASQIPIGTRLSFIDGS